MRTGNWSTHSASRTTWPNSVTTVSGFILGSTRTTLATITIKSTISCSTTYRWASLTYTLCHSCLSCTNTYHPASSIQKVLKPRLTLSRQRSFTPWGGQCWGSHPNSNCLGWRLSFILAMWPNQRNLLQEIMSAKDTVKPALLLTSSLLICWEICKAHEISNNFLKQRWWKVSKACTSLCFTGQVYTAYNKTPSTTAW